ncbi:MAG TPA: ABC transporter ATP-binding protein [Oculatellaceae cyanobacterium]|jgi:ATP-binding cassette subfamily B multidrug efflux pump
MPSNSAKNQAAFSLLWKYRDVFLCYAWQTGLGLLMLVIVNVCGVSIPLLIKQAIDTIQSIHPEVLSSSVLQEKWGLFYNTLWLIAGIATISLISRILSRIFLLGVGRYVEFDLRNRIFKHLLQMPPAYYSAHPAGELMSRMTNDVDATKFLTGGGLMLGGNTLFAYLFVIPMMLRLNWQLSLVTFLLYPVIIWVMGKLSKKVRLGYQQVQEVLADISTVSQENLNGMMVIQSYAREQAEANRFQTLCDRYFGTYTKLIHERILLFMVLAVLSGFSTWLVLLVGGSQVITKTLDWGGFVAFMMYLEYLSWPTMALGWTISIFQQGIAALGRIDDVLSARSHIQTLSGAKPLEDKPEIRGDIELRDLSFTYHNPYYPDEPIVQQPALRHLSLKIAPGETIAFVGPVGSGKSTLLRLLPRLEAVPKGTVYLDGRDITELDLAELRRQVVFMPQTSFLFSTTVSHNVAFGKPQALELPESESSIIEAAQTAQVHQDILRLPKQYQTLVGERGVMLSGGQRQRVALARTLMMDAPVLLLDDPFSNVDTETERQIILALRERKAFHKKTTLIATHRFSLISLCDRVVLMDAGEIVAIGTHAELLETQPLYRKLHRLQELRDRLGDWGVEPQRVAVAGEGWSGDDEEVLG